MNRPMRWSTWIAALAVAGLVGRRLFAQPAGAAAARGPYRKLAPGVLLSVDPARELEESFSRHDVVELLARDPTFDWAKDEPFRHDVFTLEFRFKPMRMIRVDVPQPGGYMKPTLIWYMVYSVTNRKIEEKVWYVDYNEAEKKFQEKSLANDVSPGGQKAAVPLVNAGAPPKFGWMHPLESADGKYRVQFRNGPIRFIPEFLLESPELDKPYRDQVIPIAVGNRRAPGPIWKREDPRREFYTSVEICDREIQPGETVWGVVTWDGSLPQMGQIDRFFVYVQGLTNAYLWQDTPGAYKKGDRLGTGRTLWRKTLRLTFWRPGDEYHENERELRYGLPEEVDYQWVYRYKESSGQWVYLDKDKDGKRIHLYRHDWVWRYKDDNDGRWIYAYKDHEDDWVFWYRDYGDSFWRTRAKRRDGTLIYLYKDRDEGWIYVYKHQDGTWRKLADGSVFEKMVPPPKRRFPLS